MWVPLLIVFSNKSFSARARSSKTRWPVAAMVDRLAHHAAVMVLKGKSYRLRGKSKEMIAAEQTH